jgi:protein-S-isoprenylcysteine O-methyltransferase
LEWKRLGLIAGVLWLIGVLEGLEVARQRRRGGAPDALASNLDTPDPVSSHSATGASATSHSATRDSATSDRDPASCRLLALTWWPAGLAALAACVVLPGLDLSRNNKRAFSCAGLAITGLGVALRQWAIFTLGRYFVGRVLVQPEQSVIASGPYCWLRHPSYTGFWLEMVGIGVALGNGLSIALCTLVPLLGIVGRIRAEERELLTDLPGYRDYVEDKPRLIPLVW